MFNKVSKQFQYGKHQVVLETGIMARQADASVLVNMDDTVVLVTVVANKQVKSGQDFFPLAVDYFEKNYAVGKIPGGYIKRETKPSDHEVLIARLIDRPIRPLFPEGFYHDIHVVAQVLSLNPEVSPAIPAILGASAALCLSGVPFNGPIAAAKVGYINNELVLNPSLNELKNSKLELVVAGTKEAILMVESEAKELSEDLMLSAIMFAHAESQQAIVAINQFITEVNPVMWDYKAPIKDLNLFTQIKNIADENLQLAFNIRQKGARSEKISQIWNQVKENLISTEQLNDHVHLNTLRAYFSELEASIVRGKILRGEPRIDGRDTKTVRTIDIRSGILPKTHGSALFTRGETQALAISTLGTKVDEQMVDAISGGYSERFMLHYNFPPFATGEAGRIGPPKRREIGHGNLAKRALRAVLPDDGVFPYSIRVVSEILESNGSSSMATVCGGCLSMMDAGVPLKNHVAGVAMGLILEDNKFAILTDILGDEDHLGDMDFKVAGTDLGITALQMDIKIIGITKPIMQVALAQASAARMHILGLMKEAMPYPRVLSDRAPQVYTMQVGIDKIKDVIGKGGSMIKSIIAETGATIDIGENGTIVIAGATKEATEAARIKIEGIVVNAIVGEVYSGTVTRILDKNMGAMVAILNGREGFVHVSQIANERVNDVRSYLKEGQNINVKVIEFDDRGRMRLSIKATLSTNIAENNIIPLTVEASIADATII